MGLLGDGILGRLSVLRRRRNRVIHQGYIPSDDEALECVEFALQLLLIT